MDSARPVMDLEKELACSICTELLYHPLTLLDCLHTFCGACLKEWFDWQAAAARTSPDPPAPGAAIFTCPSCRAAVRDTRHNSTVQSLLDMILVAHPEKAKSQSEKDEMDARYKPGQKVLPEVKIPRRTAEQTRLQEQERLLIDEVREMSLREAVTGDSSGGGGGSSASRTRRRTEDSDSRSRTARRRAPRATSTTRDHSSRGGDQGQERTSRRRELGADARRRTDPAARLSREATESPSVLSRNSSSASRRTRDDSLERQRRQIEHQSSLRSLISSSDAADIDMEREVEEFARQIQEEGLLDGLDLDNIDLTNNDELSRRITEAYRRRQRDRERQRREARDRSRTVTYNSGTRGASHSHERSASDSLRPTERQSRTPSTTSQSDERSRPPPSSRSSFLEVQEQQRRRRRNGSHSRDRSATVPVAPTQAEMRIGSRSQTDLETRAHSLASSSRRPILPEEARSISTSELPSSSPRFVESPPTTSLPFSARMNSLGLAQSQERTSTPPETSKRASRPKPKGLVVQPPENQATTAIRGMAGLVVSPTAGPSSSYNKQRSPLFQEPKISCNRCGKDNIQYELHYNCADCHEGQWNICLNCYRAGKGCLHWFGFGYGGFSKWERYHKFQPSIAEPHKLLASRFIAPSTMIRSSDSNSANRKVWSSEDPYERLQSGTFCALCLAWTNDCYWRCEVCNEGDWGFCNDCVNQGRSCTHGLLPLVHQQEAQQPASPPPSPHSSHPSSATMMVGLNATSIGPFKVLTFITTCDVCRNPIAPTQSRFHCFDCVSSIVPHSRPGDYDICEGCYNNLVRDGAISRENGFAGWRRCLQGHRMVVVDFQEGKGGQRRYVVRDLVGGRRLKMEEVESEASLQRWTWPQGDSECERLVAKNVCETAVQGPAPNQSFPPDGGFGWKAVAGWAWYPAEGAGDELPFPKGAEITEVEDANGEWYHGVYMGNKGLFPAPYVTVLD